ncbi:glycosyltransferase [Morganella morganii]|nr:glycosyltransferase [Morganella morganii]
MSDITKIIIAGRNISGFGGMETVFSTFSRLLTESGKNYQISFVFFNELNNSVDDTWLGNNPFTRFSSSLKNGKLKRVYFACQFASAIKKINPDYIIAFDSVGCYISRLALRFAFKRIPLFSWNHFSVTGSYKAKYIKLADKHLSISSGIATQLSEMGINPSDIYTIYNPVPEQSKTITCGNTINFLYAGRLMCSGQKNMKELFSALSGVHGDWKLHIVGSGDDSEIKKLNSLAHDLKIDDKIIWHGWQSNPWNYIEQEIKNVSALLLTSTYEGLPMVLCEANSYGIYTVSSDCPTGPADIIRQYVNGELYPAGDDKNLTVILNKIVSGETKTNHDVIKNSIPLFYENEYLARVLDIFK